MEGGVRAGVLDGAMLLQSGFWQGGWGQGLKNEELLSCDGFWAKGLLFRALGGLGELARDFKILKPQLPHTIRIPSSASAPVSNPNRNS